MNSRKNKSNYYLTLQNKLIKWISPFEAKHRLYSIFSHWVTIRTELGRYDSNGELQLTLWMTDGVKETGLILLPVHTSPSSFYYVVYGPAGEVGSLSAQELNWILYDLADIYA